MNPVVPLIPESAPFSPEQRAWLNGFFAGLWSRAPVAGSPAPSAVTPPAAALQPLTIVYGSQTGTAEALARKAAKAAARRQFAPTVLDMARLDLPQLATVQHLLVITSTYGDGEPPDNAKALHAALKAAGTMEAGPSASRLGAVRYSVCALGDSNYAQFCQCGKELDFYLERLGATRVSARADCDVDYDAPFTAWLDAALAALVTDVSGTAPRGNPTPALAAPAEALQSETAEPADPGAGHSRHHPFPAPVLTVRKLNAPGSTKEVNHVEFSLEESGLTYEPGDALGVVPQNCPELVDDILAALGCDGEEAVPAPTGTPLSLRRALTEFYDLGKPTPELQSLTGTEACADAPASASRVAPAIVVGPVHVIDVLLAKKGPIAPAAFVAALRKLQPRLYSISSSPRAHAGQVHLTVGAVRYESAGRLRRGVCSTFLAERALAAGRVGVFVHRNPAFRLPPSAQTPVIMVGPGTGIAPFRAFLAERQATGASGHNWLFFGDQHEATDFLYRDELLALQAGGTLTRLDLAWSRDQAGKIYVQHRLLEHAAELFAWLEAGAHFYVCGDAARMAKDVDSALHRIVESAGGRTPDQAAAYVQALRAERRYQRDVY